MFYLACGGMIFWKTSNFNFQKKKISAFVRECSSCMTYHKPLVSDGRLQGLGTKGFSRWFLAKNYIKKKFKISFFFYTLSTKIKNLFSNLRTKSDSRIKRTWHYYLYKTSITKLVKNNFNRYKLFQPEWNVCESWSCVFRKIDSIAAIVPFLKLA